MKDYRYSESRMEGFREGFREGRDETILQAYTNMKKTLQRCIYLFNAGDFFIQATPDQEDGT